jgi:hypothetical protein
MTPDISSGREARPGNTLTRLVFGILAELAGHASYRLIVWHDRAAQFESFAVRRHGPYVGQ